MIEIYLEKDHYVFVFQDQKYIFNKDYDQGAFEIDLDISDFKFENGKAVAVKIDGEYYEIKEGGFEKTKGNNRSGHYGQSAHQPKMTYKERRNLEWGEKPARGGSAPYNFVKTPSELHAQPAHWFLNHDIYNSNLLHGYIDFEIRTLTPLMIRGENEQFFKINNVPTIPGSSIRGMISSMIEMLSGGLFWSFNNRRIYQRNMFPDGTSSHLYYDEKTKNTLSSAGFIKFNKKDRNYYLFEKNVLDKGEPDKREKEFTIKFKNHNKPVFYISSGKLSTKEYQVAPAQKFPGFESQSLTLLDAQDIEDYKNDTNRNTKQSDRENSYGDPIYLARRIAKTGNKGKVIFKAYEDYGVPVFYSTWLDENGKKRYLFGHTKNFRIGYQKRIGDHFPKSLQQPEVLDFRKVLFGDTDTAAGKIQVEDLQINKSDQDIYLQTEICKVLSSPKPSYYPGYIYQPDGVRTKRKNLHHWGSNHSEARGYKLYHHINRDDHWIETEIRISEKHLNDYFTKKNTNHGVRKNIIDDLGGYKSLKGGFYKPIKKYSTFQKITKEVLYDLVFNKQLKLPQQYAILQPIKRNQLFKGGRIRFANLSKEELGLLLIALELQDSLRHKLGYAKPYGLGSIRIENLEVCLHDRKKRYQKVFTETASFETGKMEKKEVNEICVQSKEALYQHYNCKDEIEFWNLPRNKDLTALLHWNEEAYKKDEWLKKTRYLGLKETKNKVFVLPTLDEFFHGTNYLKKSH